MNAKARADEAEAQKKALDDHIKTLKVIVHNKSRVERKTSVSQMVVFPSPNLISSP